MISGAVTERTAKCPDNARSLPTTGVSACLHTAIPLRESSIATLTTLAATSLDTGSMSAASNNDAYIDINTAQGIVNQEATMFFVGSHTTLKDMVWESMSGFQPYATDDKDVDHATLKGVYLRLDPNSPITKSPYIHVPTVP